MVRTLVLACPSGSRVIPVLAESLRATLESAGAQARVFSPSVPSDSKLNQYRFSFPRIGHRARWLTGAAWVARYFLCQLEMAVLVQRHRRNTDALVLFLSCHFLLPALWARILGIPILYLPGGLPHHRAPAVHPLFRALVRLSTMVGFESEVERVAAGESTTSASGALRGMANVPVGTPPSGRRDVLFLSRLEEHKGLKRLLSAAKNLPEPYRLVIAGDGSLAAQVARAAAEDPRIHFAGWVSDEQRIQLLRQARLLVLPTSEGEGVPTVILEAFHCGTPVLVSDVGGIREVVQDGETGFIIPPGAWETFGELLSATVRRDDMDAVGEGCRNLAWERLTLSAAGDRFRNLLARTVESPAPAHGLRRYWATAASLGNALAGWAAIVVVMMAGPHSAWMLPLFAMGLVLDGIDGALARRYGSIPSGSRWDALGDAVTYVALPASIILLANPLAAVVFFAAGIARLVRFLATPEAVAYRGLPTSVAGTLFVLLSQIEEGRTLTPAFALVLAGLMHAPWPYPKLRGNERWLAVLASLAILHAAAFALVPPFRQEVLLSGLCVTLLILIVGPFVAWRRHARATGRSPAAARNT